MAELARTACRRCREQKVCWPPSFPTWSPHQHLILMFYSCDVRENSQAVHVARDLVPSAHFRPLQIARCSLPSVHNPGRREQMKRGPTTLVRSPSHLILSLPLLHLTVSMPTYRRRRVCLPPLTYRFLFQCRNSSRKYISAACSIQP